VAVRQRFHRRTIILNKTDALFGPVTKTGLCPAWAAWASETLYSGHGAFAGLVIANLPCPGNDMQTQLGEQGPFGL
jgi:hypothetical protein